MPAYKCIVSDASDGGNKGEAPLTLTSPISTVLNGVGQVSGTIPRDHPTASEDWLEGDRELTIWRGLDVVFNGPITLVAGALSSDTVSITAREASWYFTKRTLEVDKTYTSQDVNDIIRDLTTYMTSKTSTAGDGTSSVGTNINAALPRFSVSSGTSGVTETVNYFGSARHYIWDIIEPLLTQIDYRMDYATGSVRQQLYRTFTLGTPTLGVTHEDPISAQSVFDFPKSMDRERGASRTHVLSGVPTYTQQDLDALTTGDILIESVIDRSDLTTTAQVTAFGNDLRRRVRPPITTYTFSYVPRTNGPFAYGWCALGDHLRMNVGTGTVLHSTGHLRVAQLDVTPETDSAPELVTVTLNVPLDGI